MCLVNNRSFCASLGCLCSCYQEKEEDEGEDADEGSDAPDDQPAAKYTRGAGSRAQAAVSMVGSKAVFTCQYLVQHRPVAGWVHLLARADVSVLQHEFMNGFQMGLSFNVAHVTEPVPRMHRRLAIMQATLHVSLLG